MGGGSTPQFKPPTGLPAGLPDYVNFLDPQNIGQAGVGSAAYQTATDTDLQTQMQTFNALRQRAPEFFKSMKLENQHLLDLERGIDPNAQAVQNSLLKAGLTGSAGAFGDATNNEAGIARNLGLGISDYAQGLRNERRSTLQGAQGLAINQPIQVGYTGKDALELAMNQTANQNNYNTAGYQIGAGMAGTELQAQMSAANSQAAQQGQSIAAIGTILAAIIGAAAICWVAREVFKDERNPNGFTKWIIFRDWLIHRSPRWQYGLYMAYGESFARWLKKHPWAIDFIKPWFESKITSSLKVKMSLASEYRTIQAVS